jgi:protein gp37
MNRNLYYGNGLDYTVQGLSQVDLQLVNLDQPLRWQAPRGVFWCSMTDWMGDFVQRDFQDAMLATALKADRHRHAFLTKRAKEMAGYFRAKDWRKRVFAKAVDLYVNRAHGSGFRHWASDAVKFPKHVWLGVTVHDQKSADEYGIYMAILRDVLGPEAVLWVSYEPALGPVDWHNWEGVINWLVCGGESGANARPMNPDWALSARDWCQANGVAFHFKQWGEFSYGPIIKDESFEGGAYVHANVMTSITRATRLDDRVGAVHVGKKRAGRLLDGREWNEFPKV